MGTLKSSKHSNTESSAASATNAVLRSQHQQVYLTWEMSAQREYDVLTRKRLCLLLETSVEILMLFLAGRQQVSCLGGQQIEAKVLGIFCYSYIYRLYAHAQVCIRTYV